MGITGKKRGKLMYLIIGIAMSFVGGMMLLLSPHNPVITDLALRPFIIGGIIFILLGAWLKIVRKK